MVQKTNAARSLDRLGISYELRTYDYDPADLDAEKAAAGIGLPPQQVFKTLVIRGDQTGVCLAVIPSHRQLDLKALAKLSGDRKVQPVPLKEVQALTGYIRGGVTALACKKAYPVYGDSSLVDHAAIAVSAGTRGMLMVLAPQDYVRSVQATLGAIATAD